MAHMTADKVNTRGRVLMLGETYFPHHGGSERVGHNCALELTRAGWEVEALVPQMEGAEAWDRGQPYEITRSGLWSHVRSIEHSRGGILNRAARFGFQGMLLPRLLARRWDVLIALHGTMMGLPGWWLRKLSKRPLVVWLYGEDLEMGRKSSGTLWQLRQSMKSARLLVVISRETARIAEELGGDPEKMLLQFPVPDELFFEDLKDRVDLRRDIGLGDQLVLLTISRLVERKGIDTVLHALAEVERRRESANKPPARWQYFIGGTGPDQSRLEDLTRELGLDSNVTFLGPCEPDRAVDLMQAADLFLMPNRRLASGEQEGFGIVFVEAALRGTPSIGGRSGGTADAIAEGESGWLVNPDSPHELADRLEALMSRPEKLRGMRPQCRTWAVETFESHRRHEPLLAALEGFQST